MSARRPSEPGARSAERSGSRTAAALAGCLALVIVGCVADDRRGRDDPNGTADASSAADSARSEPLWKPPPPPPPEPCGLGCVEGTGNAVVRYQMADGDHTATVRVEGNHGVFAVGPPVNISEKVSNWSAIRTFHVPKAGVQSLSIEATGSWTLSILKGTQTFVEGEPPS